MTAGRLGPRGNRGMGRPSTLRILGGLGLAIVFGASAQELPLARTDDGRWANVIATSRGKLDSLRRTMSIPGLSISVSVDQQVVWSEGMGYADLELSSPATPLTRYRIGSVSKVLTAAGVALLHQRGELDLDAPVQAYVPSFPRKPEGEVTTRLLAVRRRDPRDRGPLPRRPPNCGLT